MKVHVVGAGLIGTSVGLALAGESVVLSDPSTSHLERAVQRGAGRAWDGVERADIVLVCVPPRATAAIVQDVLVRDLGTTVSHVASHQSGVQAEVEALSTASGSLAGFCGGHPMAGSERSGPDAATARLFQDRPWVVCPAPTSGSLAVDAVHDLALACGALPLVTTPEQHDAAVALVSHLPQLAASAVAARLADRGAAADHEADRDMPTDGPTGHDPSTAFDPLQLAGPGVQDVTRIAASDTGLWVDVLTRNAHHVAPLARAVAADLERVADVLDALGAEGPHAQVDVETVLTDLLDRGRRGRALLPLKRGRDTALAPLVVALSDEPGQLAAVLGTAAEAGANVEDVRVEHLPGRARGLVELLVPPADLARARSVLLAAGWEVLHAPDPRAPGA